MSRFTVRFLLGCLLLSFGIFFGVDLSTKGMERIQGPRQPNAQTAAAAHSQQERKPEKAKAAVTAIAAVKREAPKQPQKEPTPEITADSLINRMGNKTGELLQITAYHGIKMFVSLFDGIFK